MVISNKLQDQEEIWDYVASNWKENRNIPHKEVIEFLKDKKGKIMDLGCGSGRDFIDGDFEIYGVDFSKNMLKLAREFAENNKIKAKLFKANAWELPFKDNHFDYAIFIAALHCIHHNVNREKSVQELKRVMKKGARALITVWDKNQPRFIDKKEVYLPWGAGDFPNRQEFLRYYYLYDKDEILKLLEKYFKIIRIQQKDEKNRFSKRNLIIEVEKV